MKREINVDRKEHSFSVLGRVDEMRRDKQYCDFLIKVDSEEIHAHRNILAGGSDYFHAMFSHDTKENKSGVVEMLGVDPECAIICIDHIYGGKAFVPDGKDQEMMYVADLMQLHTLRDAITTSLGKELDPKSFFLARKIANLYGCKKLEDQCSDFATDNFLDISFEKEFGELEKSFVEKMIKSKKVKMPEEQKLDVLLKWIKHDSERNAYLIEAMKFIDFTTLPPGYSRYLLENETLIKESKECLLLLSISALDTLGVTPSPAHCPALPETMIALFDLNSYKIQQFDLKDGSCTPVNELNEDMRNYYYSALLLERHIYVLTRARSLYRLSCPVNAATWEKMADCITAHETYPCVTVLSGSIYLMTKKWIEAYDPSKNQWSKVVDKPKPSKRTHILGSRRYIYCFGGHYDGQWKNDFYRFDIECFRYEYLEPMKQARGDGTALEFGGKIYVFGGFDGKDLQTTECYDISSNTWTALKPMLAPRRNLKSYVIGKEIYIVERDRGQLIEKYNIESDEWKIVKKTNLGIWESVAI